MNQKTYNIIFVLVVIILIGASFYFVGLRKSNSTNSDNTTATTTEYVNNQYGFRFTLPVSWTGYTVFGDGWQGNSLDTNGQNSPSETGPLIYIRNPKWTEANPMQDIPIMVFTLKQWDDMQNDKFHIGAAPINPSELGRNNTYVFALPARYNFAFLSGYEEVDRVIQSHPLHAF